MKKNIFSVNAREGEVTENYKNQNTDFNGTKEMSELYTLLIRKRNSMKILMI
jgi:hypothetical protein